MKKTSNIRKLVRLIEENPELEVLPMVEGEVVAENIDSSVRWMATVGDSEIREFILGEDKIYFKEEYVDGIEEMLVDVTGNSKFYNESEEVCLDAYASLPWERVIVIDINTPEF